MPKYRYNMPPEWSPHAMTLMTWPDNRETWPGEQLNRAEHVFADIVETLAPFEPVVLLVANEQAHQAAASMIQNRNVDWNQIRLVRMPVNDVWIRDYGPITLLQQIDDEDDSGRKEVIMSDWDYNAWGGKYPPYDDDNAVPQRIAALLEYPVVVPGMVLEGGSIDVNGAGSLLSTESVLLNPNRNPGMEKAEIEAKLREYLGAGQVIWLKGGLAGDDTDGHVDDLARFVSERTIVAAVSDDPDDPNYEVLRENRRILDRARDPHGRPFEIVELPLPATRIPGTTVDGSAYVPASYVNFYIANGCVLVPLYDRQYDDMALDIFRRLFPNRRVIGIRSRDLVWGQGSIHCITQQVVSLH